MTQGGLSLSRAFATAATCMLLMLKPINAVDTFAEPFNVRTAVEASYTAST